MTDETPKYICMSKNVKKVLSLLIESRKRESEENISSAEKREPYQEKEFIDHNKQYIKILEKTNKELEQIPMCNTEDDAI